MQLERAVRIHVASLDADVKVVFVDERGRHSLAGVEPPSDTPPAAGTLVLFTSVTLALEWSVPVAQVGTHDLDCVRARFHSTLAWNVWEPACWRLSCWLVVCCCTSSACWVDWKSPCLRIESGSKTLSGCRPVPSESHFVLKPWCGLNCIVPVRGLGVVVPCLHRCMKTHAVSTPQPALAACCIFSFPHHSFCVHACCRCLSLAGRRSQSQHTGHVC